MSFFLPNASSLSVLSVLSVVSLGLLAARPAHGAVFTVGGFSFDQDHTPRNLQRVQWGQTVTDVSGIGEVVGNSSWLSGFDIGLSTGRLLSGHTPLSGSPNTRSLFLAFGIASGGNASSSATIFSIAELRWGTGEFIQNGPGDELAIYEAAAANSPEAFAARIQDVAGNWSDWRYEKVDSWTDIPGTSRDFTATGFDLASFGSGFDKVQALQMVNLLPGSRVSDASGEGFVSLDGTAAGFTFQPLKANNTAAGLGNGSSFSAGQFDADIAYVASLTVTQAIPEPEQYALMTLGLLAAASIWRCRRNRCGSQSI